MGGGWGSLTSDQNFSRKMGGTELLMDFPWRSLETPRQIRQKLSTFGGQATATICDTQCVI